MRRLFLFLLPILFFSCTTNEGCDDEDALNYDIHADENDGSCVYGGKIVFWTNEDSCGVIDVSLDNISVGKVTGYFNTAPECNEFGALTIEVASGNYEYAAADSCGVWFGSINVQPNTCTTKELPR